MSRTRKGEGAAAKANKKNAAPRLSDELLKTAREAGDTHDNDEPEETVEMQAVMKSRRLYKSASDEIPHEDQLVDEIDQDEDNETANNRPQFFPVGRQTEPLWQKPENRGLLNPGSMSVSGDQFDEDQPSQHEYEIARRHRAYLARRLRESARRAQASRARSETRLDEPHEEAEAMLAARQHRRARASGHRLVRNLALTASAAVIVGAGVGLALVAADGRDTGLNRNIHDVANWLNPFDRQPVPVQTASRQPEAQPQVSNQPTTIDTATIQPQNRSVAQLIMKPKQELTAAARSQSTVVAKPDNGKVETEQPAAPKAVKIMAVHVADVSGIANQPVPLKVEARSSEELTGIALRLSGLPRNSRLTAGEELSDGSWLLEPGDTADLKLIVPPTTSGKLTVSVEALDMDTGKLAAPVKEMRVAVAQPPVPVPVAAQPPETDTPVVVEPAAVAVNNSRNFAASATPSPTIEKPQARIDLPPPVPEPEPEAASLPKAVEPPAEAGVETNVASLQPVPELVQPATSDPAFPAINALVSRGEELLALGDVIAARRLFEKAAENGDAGAAVRVGRTYDPAVFEQLRVHGLRPDAKAAMRWYEKAKTAGHPEAERNISALSAWLKR